jgi:hypothetical protein
MMNWGGKNWRPGAPTNRRQPINQSVAELMKPLGEKSFQGNVWGSVIMNVPLPDTTPSPTPTPTPVPYVRFVGYGVSDVALVESPTYYSYDGSIWSASTTSSRNTNPNSQFALQYNTNQSLWMTTSSDGILETSTDGITFSFGGFLGSSVNVISQGVTAPVDFNVGYGSSLECPTLPTNYTTTSVTSYGAIFGGCGSGVADVIYCSFPTQDMWLAGPARCTADSYGYNISNDPVVDTWVSSPTLNDYVGNTYAFASNYNSSTQSETLVVAVGGAGTGITSSLTAISNDGINWTGDTSGLNSNFQELYCVIWDGTQWIAGGKTSISNPGPLLATSTDGLTWIINTGATESSTYLDNITDITFDGTTYVAVGQNALIGTIIITSTDLQTWTTATLSLPAGVALYKLDSNPHPYRR